MKVTSKLLMVFVAGLLSAMPLSGYSSEDRGGARPGGIAIQARFASLSLSPVRMDIISGVGVTLNFTPGSGWVDVLVLDSYGSEVYSGSVSTDSASQEFLSTFGYPSGLYTVIVSDQTGSVIYQDNFSL